MLINKSTINILNTSYFKIKINYLFLKSKFILFVFIDKTFDFKFLFLKYNIYSLILKESQIKTLFDLPHYSFLRGGGYLCGFIDDEMNFIKISRELVNKQMFFFYKNNISNVIGCSEIFDLFDKYNNNYIYIQFTLNKVKIKVIILLLFFLISFTFYIK